MQLSPHFSLPEMTRSETARRLKLDNTPTPKAMAALMDTAQRMEQVRIILGNRPLTIISAYRSPEVNRAVGGSKTSAHLRGHAVDFTAPHLTPREVVRALRSSQLEFDQIILYRRHTHLGWAREMRRQFIDETVPVSR